MKNPLANWFAKPADNNFIVLMQVVMEDPMVRDQLTSILSLPDQVRRKTLARWPTTSVSCLATR